MTYRLRDGLSFCWIEGSAIFLDSERDRYFTLGGDAARALRTLGEGGSAGCDDIRRLVELGLIKPGDGHGRPITAEQHLAPARSLMDSSPRPTRHNLCKVVHVALRTGQARRQLARTPVGNVLRDLRRRKSQAAVTPPSVAMLERAAVFNQARASVPLASRCLADSLALIEDLATVGFHPDLIFGVRLSPFGAHCWVQAGDIALNDALDRIRAERMNAGTVNHAPVYPREVVRRALELSASAVLLAHNHPTGDPNPSSADVEMTRQVVAACRTLDIAVHDHFIVGGDQVASLKVLGLM